MAEEFDHISHLSHVHIEGYKSIDNLDVDLLPGLNIIIGKNGSGKSNFLEVVHKSFMKNFPLSPRQIEITISTEKGKSIIWKYVNTSTFKKDKLNLVSTSSININNEYVQHSASLLSVNDTNWEDFMHAFSIYKIEFVSPQKVSFQLPDLFFNQLNYKVVVNSIDPNLSYSFLWKEIEKLLISIEGVEKIEKDLVLKNLTFDDHLKSSLKRFSPISGIRFSENFNIHSDDRQKSIENIYPEFNISGNWVPWSYLSDGTKRLFYLIYSVCKYDQGIIFIEEPELGVHPHQFFDIMTFLNEESKNKQIIIATHSPEALNILGPDDLDRIILTEYSSKKGTTMKHLSAAQKKKANIYMKEVGFLSDYWLHSDLEK